MASPRDILPTETASLKDTVDYMLRPVFTGRMMGPRVEHLRVPDDGLSLSQTIASCLELPQVLTYIHA
jgi:hypothetical protein